MHGQSRVAEREDQSLTRLSRKALVTTDSPAHAWYVALDGARMYYGGKDQSFMLWPARPNPKTRLA